MGGKVKVMEFPRLDVYGTPTEKLPNCPRCGEDELGVIHEHLLFCYSCTWSVESQRPSQAERRDRQEALRDAEVKGSFLREGYERHPSLSPLMARKARSSGWRKVREDFLFNHPSCEVCGNRSDLEVHHVHPFHLEPDRELDPANLVTLCCSGPGSVNCHLVFGHCGAWITYNPTVTADVGFLSQLFKGKLK